MPEYRLIGFYNSFQFVPDFVYPVYQYRDTLYFQHVDHNCLTFVPICLPVHTQLIRLQDDDMTFTSDCMNVYHSFNQQLFAYQADENNIIFGNLNYIQCFFRCYLSAYATSLDDILLTKINQTCNRKQEYKTIQATIHIPCQFIQYNMLPLHRLRHSDCNDTMMELFSEKDAEYKTAYASKRSVPIKNASVRRF